MKSKSTSAKKTTMKKSATQPGVPAKKSAAKKSAQPAAKKASKTPAVPPVTAKPSAEPIHTKESPFARGAHTKADRHEIREITHRVMGSRQSQRPVERHNQTRKKR